MRAFQKKLQGDDVTIVDIVPETNRFTTKLEKLNDRPLVGGWEEKFYDNYDEDDNTFFGTVLWQKERRRGNRNLFVSEIRAFPAIRVEVLLSLRQFMEKRLDIDDRAKDNFRSFVKLKANENDVREIHTLVAPDLDLRSLADQYNDIQESDISKDGNPKALLKQLCRQEHYKEVAQVMARILVCKPHSADCERLVSVYSNLKTSTRSRLLRETISNYLYVNMNMPVLTMFDPRPAVHYFLQDRNRRVRDTPKADRQVWFRKVFENESQDEEMNEKKPLQRSF